VKTRSEDNIKKDEIGRLAESFGRMIANIRGQAMAAERIAAGDLTVEVAVKSENDLLGKKLWEMLEKNNEVLTNISSAAEQVAAFRPTRLHRKKAPPQVRNSPARLSC